MFRTGIPQLDEILEGPGYDEPRRKQYIRLQPIQDDVTTVAILGPDGTGKSVFSMHIASTYLADAIRDKIYDGCACRSALRPTDASPTANQPRNTDLPPAETALLDVQANRASSVPPNAQGAGLPEQLPQPRDTETDNPSNAGPGGFSPQTPEDVKWTADSENATLEVLYGDRSLLPLVLYVSTDLSHGRAEKVWRNFALNFPWSRHIPYEQNSEIQFRRNHVLNPIQIKLELLKPDSLGEFLEKKTLGEEEKRQFCKTPFNVKEKEYRSFKVGFLDLATETAGDDWDLVMRIVSSVEKNKDCTVPNLLIIDSVAGFETLTGDLNAFGLAVSRRARIAQLIRAVQKNWSTVFVVEEPKPGEHHPEEFVTDMVIRLRREGSGPHVRRLLEIEKARAQSYGMGEHPFDIRDGRGTSTGSWQNPDDPYAEMNPAAIRRIEELWCSYQKGNEPVSNAYLQVFQSLHFRSRALSKRVNIFSPKARQRLPRSGFGLAFLDSLLGGESDTANCQGLSGNTVTALIGDEGTRKMQLAQQFLRTGFTDVVIRIEFAQEIARKLLVDKTKAVADILASDQPPPGLEHDLWTLVIRFWTAQKEKSLDEVHPAISIREWVDELRQGWWQSRKINSGPEARALGGVKYFV